MDSYKPKVYDQRYQSYGALVSHTGKLHRYCRHCNDCSHGFAIPTRRCMKCYPGIACVACGLVPRKKDQTNITEAYRGMCSTCYRETTGNHHAGIPFKSLKTNAVTTIFIILTINSMSELWSWTIVDHLTEEKLQSVYTRCQSTHQVLSKMLRMKCW